MSNALVIIDMQNDFMPWGALPVKGADKLISPINALMPHFDFVIATLDYHPKDHISFAATHGLPPGQIIEMGGVSQRLWPTHCVESSLGAELAPALHVSEIDQKIYKGTDPHIDSYSAFFDNAKSHKTNLENYLHKHAIKELFFVGVATEFCVQFSVLDALSLDFSVSVLEDVCRGISSEKEAFQNMQKKGAKLLSSSYFLEKK